MTSPRGQIPHFRRGDTLKASSLETLRNRVLQSSHDLGQTSGEALTIAVILDEDLDAPTSALEPTYANSTVCVWDPLVEPDGVH